MRLIDADAVLEILETRDNPFVRVAVMHINNAPTIDPVKHGRWVSIEDKYIDVCKCSECEVIEYFNKGWKKFNFCPNCGAFMMDGGEEDGRM